MRKRLFVQAESEQKYMRGEEFFACGIRIYRPGLGEPALPDRKRRDQVIAAPNGAGRKDEREQKQACDGKSAHRQRRYPGRPADVCRYHPKGTGRRRFRSD